MDRERKIFFLCPLFCKLFDRGNIFFKYTFALAPDGQAQHPVRCRNSIAITADLHSDQGHPHKSSGLIYLFRKFFHLKQKLCKRKSRIFSCFRISRMARCPGHTNLNPGRCACKGSLFDQNMIFRIARNIMKSINFADLLFLKQWKTELCPLSGFFRGLKDKIHIPV